MKIATFTYGNGRYYPANKNAIAASSVLSMRFLRHYNMQEVRSLGYTPMLMDGTEIGKVDIKV